MENNDIRWILFKAKSMILHIIFVRQNKCIFCRDSQCVLELSMFVFDLMMEICPPTNRSHEEDSKAVSKVAENECFRQHLIDIIPYWLFYWSIILYVISEAILVQQSSGNNKLKLKWTVTFSIFTLIVAS